MYPPECSYRDSPGDSQEIIPSRDNEVNLHLCGFFAKLVLKSRMILVTDVKHDNAWPCLRVIYYWVPAVAVCIPTP